MIAARTAGAVWSIGIAPTHTEQAGGTHALLSTVISRSSEFWRCAI
jgi:hypothetical protein